MCFVKSLRWILGIYVSQLLCEHSFDGKLDKLPDFGALVVHCIEFCRELFSVEDTVSIKKFSIVFQL